MASYTKKIALNTVVQIVGKAITTFISVVMLGYLSRYLGVSGYGEYTVVFAFLGFFAILADLGLYNIAVREMSREFENAKKILGNVATLRIALATFFLLLAPAIAYFIPSYSSEVKAGIWIGALSSFFILVNQLFVSLFQVKLRMDHLVVGDVISRIVLFILVYLFIQSGLSLQYFILANVVCNLCLCFVSFLFSRRYLAFVPQFDWDYIKYIFKEAVPLGVVIVLGLVYFRIDSIMLSLMKDSEAVGIYGAPYKVLEILITIPSMFVGSVFPLAASYFKNKDERFAISFKRTFDFIAFIAFPMLAIFFVLAEPIVLLVLGPEFIASALVLRYLMFAVLIIFFGTIMGNYIVACNLQKKLVKIYLASVVLNIALNFFLIPKYSYLGAAMATIVTEYIVCMSAYLILYKHTGVVPEFKVFLKALFTALLVGFVLKLLIAQNLLLVIVLGGALYISIMYLVKGFDRTMIKKALH